MSVVEPLTWIARRIIGKGLHEPDIISPGDLPGGWPAWFALMGYDPMSDYLPLGDPAPEGNRAAMVFTRVGEDVAVIDMSFVHIDGSDTVPFTDADRDNVQTHLASLWAAIRGNYSTDLAWERLVFHDFGVGIRSPNPARRTTVITPSPGTSEDAPMPPQDAISVTFKTDHRRSWGRCYLPAPTVPSLGEAGNIDPDVVDQIRTAFGTFADAMLAANTPLVVWAPRHDGHLLQYTSVKPKPDSFVLDVPDTSSVARGVATIQVDDLFDVIRSRRNHRATHLATHTL